MKINQLIKIPLVILLTLFFIISCDEDSKIIMAAASLEKILNDHKDEFINGEQIYLNYGGSLSLARRIETNQNKIGAVIFSSNESFQVIKDMNLIKEDSISTLAYNSLVIVSSEKKFNSLEDVKSSRNKLLIADPKVAPAGIYSKQAVEKLFEYDYIKENILTSGDVSSVSNLIRTNKNMFGIVYKTEAVKNNLNIVFNIPNNFHDKIEYKVGILKSNKSKYVEEFILTLQSKKNQNNFRELGFIVK